MSGRRQLAALGAVLLLAGCGGDPKPKVEQTPTSPTTSSTEPQQLTAQQFVTHWVEVSNAMQSNGDTAAYRRISSNCGPCMATAKRVESVYAAGGHIVTKGWEVKRTQFNASGATTDVDLWVVSSPTVVVHGDGSREHLKGGPNHFVLTIAQHGAEWVARSLAVYSR